MLPLLMETEMMHRWREFSSFMIVAGALTLAGCSNDNNAVTDGSGGPDGVSGTDAKLVVLGSKEGFYEAWRSALAGEYQRYAVDGAANGPVIAPEADGVDAGAADSPTDTGGSAVSQGDFTTTNVQEQGVDEADIVKNDGEFLYVLQNNYFGSCYTCGVVDETVDVDTSIDLPTDAPAIQSPEVRATLRILELQPEVPDASVVAEVPVELQGYYSGGGMFLYRSGESRSVLLMESNYGYYYDSWNHSVDFSGRTGALLKLDVTNPQNVSTQRLEFDGNVIASRLIDDRLVLASRYYPDIEGLDPYAYANDAEWRAAVENIDLSNALPSYTRITDGASVPLVDPSACFVANDVVEGNSWPDIITLAVFDADDLSLQSSVCFLGASETLYASTEAVFLATTRYQYDSYPQPLPVEGDGGIGSSPDGTIASDEPIPIAYSDPRIDTDIHQFDLEGSQLQYAGSGRVSGHLGWNELQKPFRMSESNGDLRVVTMSDNQDGSVSPVNLSVLRADGKGVLQTIGKLPNAQQTGFLGKPGEQLYASRFLGNRGYLVTFRSTDPLYVLDLSNPADPKLAGELEVDGYSEYLHRIDENYLLGIGMDAVPAPQGWGDGRDGGLVQGVKVSLYNVTDPAAPSEVQSLLLGQRGSYSSALYDHRAISILPPANGRAATRVAFGIDIAGTAEPVRRPEPADASNYYDWRFNALHGIEVRTGTDAGLALTGRLVASSVNDPGSYGYGSGSERVVMVGDAAYYIHGDKVRAANWNSFDNASPPR